MGGTRSMVPSWILFCAAATNLALIVVNGYLVYRNTQTFAWLKATQQQVEDTLTRLNAVNETQQRTLETLNRLGGGEQSSPDQPLKPCEEGMTLQPGEACGVMIEIPMDQLRPPLPIGKR